MNGQWENPRSASKLLIYIKNCKYNHSIASQQYIEFLIKNTQ